MLIVVTSATTIPVTVAQAREQCRAPENGDDDVLVERALRSAVEYVEENTSLILQPTTLEYRTNCWPHWSGGYRRGHEIDLPKKPVRDVVAVEYLDVDGNLQELSASNYSWRNTADGGIVRFNNSIMFPRLTSDAADPVRVIFEAGFDAPQSSGSGDDPNLNLPNRVIEAVLLKTELGYDHGGITEETGKLLQQALASVLDQLRVYR